MKKLLTLFIAFAMILTSGIVVADDDDCDCGPGCTEDCPECPPYSDLYTVDVDTKVTIAGSPGCNPGTGGPAGWENPIIKAKWEVTDTDMNDDDMVCYGTQVAPVIGGDKLVHYYAIILQRSAEIHSAYAYVWHPDCTYKYKVPLSPLGVSDGQLAWDKVKTNNPTVICYNDGYDQAEIDIEIADYLNCYVYHGCEEINYCQPGGCYKVGVRAFDGMAWSESLWNTFWYIPTAAIEVDFSTVNYGNAVTVGTNTWRDGNLVWGDNIPTVRNYGNVPVDLKVLQDDMMFAKDSTGAWNVEFDARLGPSGGTTHTYVPYCEYDQWPNGGTEADATFFGTLEVCTENKLDFSIHIKEAEPCATYQGHMTLFALRHGAPPYTTPEFNEITGEDLKDTMPPGIPLPPCCDAVGVPGTGDCGCGC